jgi:hypothetical protein
MRVQSGEPKPGYRMLNVGVTPRCDFYTYVTYFCHPESAKSGHNETHQARSRAGLPGKPGSTADFCLVSGVPQAHGAKSGRRSASANGTVLETGVGGLGVAGVRKYVGRL